jgi:hypothetical protein
MTRTKTRPLDHWILRRLLCGRPCDGIEGRVTRSLRRVADHLAGLPVERRPQAWEAFLCGWPEPQALGRCLEEVDPDGPPPEDSARAVATMADIAQILAGQLWLWPGWLAVGALNVIAAEPGVGKTRFVLDLARRLWHGEPWPDGQPNDRPRGTKTLWVLGDRNFAEVLQAVRDFGLPEEAVVLGAPAEDPTGGLDLDEPESLHELAQHIHATAPALVVLDTVGMVTARNLCRVEDARAFFVPLIELAAETEVALLGLTHLSIHKEALGRRIAEKARILIKMTHPDPDEPDRRRLWVDKTASMPPPVLGITMGGGGNTYDTDPPTPIAPGDRRPARSTAKLDACAVWLATQLREGPAKLGDLRREAEQIGFSIGTLYAARGAIGADEFFRDNRKCWGLLRRGRDGIPTYGPAEQSGRCQDPSQVLDTLDTLTT